MSAPHRAQGEPNPELSRPVVVAALKPAGEVRRITATDAEAAALARRLGVESVRDLAAEASLKPRAKGQVLVLGQLRATLGRLCVVTLEPMDEVIDQPFAAIFAPAAQAGPAAELALEPEGEDEEPYDGQGFDLGEYLAQTLAVSLDPWPRSPGAELPPAAASAPPQGEDG
jgi:hypothetical protein